MPGLKICFHDVIPLPAPMPRGQPHPPTPPTLSLSLTWLALASRGEPLTEHSIGKKVGGKGVTFTKEQSRAALVESPQPLLSGHCD